MALRDFQDWQRTKLNCSMYCLGAQGDIIRGLEDIKRFEKNEFNQKRALKLYNRLCEKLGKTEIEAFDCSGYGMRWLCDLTKEVRSDMTANDMIKRLCIMITKKKVLNGDWVGRSYTNGVIHHIGYVQLVGGKLMVLECEGRDRGCIEDTIDKLDSNGNSYWNVFARPLVFKAEIEGYSDKVSDECPYVEPTAKYQYRVRFGKKTNASQTNDACWFQYWLKKGKFYTGDIDGDAYNKTWDAISAAQVKAGIGRGNAGPKTRAYLKTL